MRIALLTSLVRAAALGLLVFLPGRGLAQSVAQHTPDHAVTSDSGASESPSVEPSKEWSHHFATPSTYTHQCKPETFMKGIIGVREVKS